jgi:hypothetical protein
MKEAPETSDREPRLDEALAEYYRAVESGRPPDRREFLERHGDLASFLDAKAELERHASSPAWLGAGRDRSHP